MILFLVFFSIVSWASIFVFYWRWQIRDWIDCRFDIFERLQQRRERAEQKKKARQDGS